MNEGHGPDWAAKLMTNRRAAVQLLSGKGTKLTLSYSVISKTEEETHNTHRGNLSSTGLFLAFDRWILA